MEIPVRPRQIFRFAQKYGPPSPLLSVFLVIYPNWIIHNYHVGAAR